MTKHRGKKLKKSYRVGKHPAPTNQKMLSCSRGDTPHTGLQTRCNPYEDSSGLLRRKCQADSKIHRERKETRKVVLDQSSRGHVDYALGLFRF